MSDRVSPLAGKPAPASILVDVPKLIDAYSALKPDYAEPAQRVAFGTSGHRGNPFERSFNEDHILATTQAICEYRASKGIDGPLFVGADTHAVSGPAFRTALEVLAANGVETMISKGGEFTPTPAISHAILVHNRGRNDHFADGIVITPSHNPPSDGGFKYNPPNGGPADTAITKAIENRANELLKNTLDGVKRIPFERAIKSATTRAHDYVAAYVGDLGNIIDFNAIRGATLKLGVDPLGGAGVHYWSPIAERYRIDLTVVSEVVDPQFAFMSVDWDGKIRMDPSSKYAMQRLIALKDRFDVAFGCDTDHDRHGIVTKSGGLMPPNHYLSTMVDYLFRHRPQWDARAAVGKTVVSTALIDRVTKRLGRKLYEVPVGFKWFADGLFDGSLGFGGEESAGASMLRRDGTVWATDKDGIVAALMSAEITAQCGKNPAEVYGEITRDLGAPRFDRIDAPANDAQKARLSKLTPDKITDDSLAGEKIESIIDRAPANDAPIGGIKVIAKNGWFAARPSGTEAIYKIYAESFKDDAHLEAILKEAQGIVDSALGA
jgi:phosphoglucomutase